MTISALDPAIALSFILGAIVACISLFATILRAKSRDHVLASIDVRALRETLAARDAELVIERVALATASATATHNAIGLVEAKSSIAEAMRNLQRSFDRTGEIERDLASAQATIAQMKLGERDVEQRLQRVAQTYVTEAREVLVKAAADRFAGDATAFRERLVAQVNPLNERLDLLG